MAAKLASTSLGGFPDALLHQLEGIRVINQPRVGAANLKMTYLGRTMIQTRLPANDAIGFGINGRDWHLQRSRKTRLDTRRNASPSHPLTLVAMLKNRVFGTSEHRAAQSHNVPEPLGIIAADFPRHIPPQAPAHHLNRLSPFFNDGLDPLAQARQKLSQPTMVSPQPPPINSVTMAHQVAAQGLHHPIGSPETQIGRAS